MKRRVIGMDAGGTKLLAGVVDEDGRVLFRTFRSWPRETTREDVLLRFETALQEAMRHSVGGGIISGGRVVRGRHGAAGEPGHMSIAFDGPPCPGDCPGRGCLEAYVSGPVLARLGYEYAARASDYQLGRVLAARGELTGADV